MNWYSHVKSSQTLEDQTKSFPMIGNDFHGFSLRLVGSSANSIDASLDNYEVVPGIRELPYNLFSDPKKIFYAADDHERARKLTETIRQTGEIEPLIIVFENHAPQKGPYILEGAHRFYSLAELGFQTFPAMVIIDYTWSENENLTAKIATAQSDTIEFTAIGEYDIDDFNYDETFVSQAFNIALNSGVNVLSDKELSYVAHQGNKVVGALFVSLLNDDYSFDVVVIPEFQQKGIGNKLTDIAISDFNDMKSDMPDLNMNVDVVNPVMQRMLQQKGLE